MYEILYRLLNSKILEIILLNICMKRNWSMRDQSIYLKKKTHTHTIQNIRDFLKKKLKSDWNAYEKKTSKKKDRGRTYG